MSSELGRWSIALALVLTVAPLRAQQAERTPAEKESARRMLDLGRDAEAKNDMARAIEHYRGAHALMGVPTTSVYLAKALARVGRLIEARDVALSGARAARLPNENAERISARSDAEALAAQLAPRVPSIAVQVQPPQAPMLEVLVDGKAVPAAVHGLPWAVDPGDHEVVVRASGYQPERRQLRLVERQAERLSIVLVAAAGSNASTIAPRRIRASDDGLGVPWTLAIVGFSVGGASLTVGGVTGALSLAKTNEIEAQCDGARCPLALRSEADAAQTLATASNVTLVVGGALALGGSIAMGVGLAGSESGNARLFVAPGYAGVAGQF